MATISFQQTDTPADSGFNIGCSGAISPTSGDARRMEVGGTPGTAIYGPDPGNSTNVAVIVMQSPTSYSLPATWAAGNYVVRIRIWSGRPNTKWVATYICERKSDGTFGTVASLTGQSISFASAGVKTMTVNRPTDYAAASGSTMYIVCVVDGEPTGGSNFNTKSDQIVDTPISSGSGASSKPYYYNQLVQGV